MKVTENLAAIQQKIKVAAEKTGRNLNDIKIIAVTKYVSIERAKEALKAGVKDLGENRDEGLLEKYDAIGEEAVWHFIGTLQTRKVKSIIDKVDFIHSLDRESLAKEINRRAKQPVSCLVQVNVSGEASKHGLAEKEVMNFIETLRLYPNIRVCGLMTMAPLTDDQTTVRNCFQKLARLQKQIQSLQLDYAPCTELSMGMSNDYELAIEEGATMIRVGTALVGQ